MLVTTSQTMMPAANPAMAPTTHPVLFALDQVTQSATGTTAEPRMQPMKVLNDILVSSKIPRLKIWTYIKPSHRDSDVEENETTDTHNNCVRDNHPV